MLAASTAYAVPESNAYGMVVTETPKIEIALPKPLLVAQKSVMASTTEYTEAIVRKYFQDIPVMIQVARCESHFRHTLADGTILKGEVDPADTGVMQINKRYHSAKAAALGLNLDNIYGNMAYARHLYETQGTRPWTASASCWGQTLAINI